MKKVLKIIARIVCFLLLSILIGYNVVLLNAKFVLHEQLPMINGCGHVIVLSGSMQPAFDVNDLLIVQHCDSYEPGDIITFVDKSNVLVTHRLIRIDEENGTFISKGDANNIQDPEMQTERIKGKVIHIIPKAGAVIAFLQNPFCVAIILVTTLILMELSYSRSKKRKNQDIDKLREEIERLKQAKNNQSPPPS